MFRKILFAMVPMALVVSSVSADDSPPRIRTWPRLTMRAIEIDTASLDGLDVDGLSTEAGEDSEEAVEAPASDGLATDTVVMVTATVIVTVTAAIARSTPTATATPHLLTATRRSTAIPSAYVSYWGCY